MQTPQKRYQDRLVELARQGDHHALAHELRARFIERSGPEPGETEHGLLDIVRWAWQSADTAARKNFVAVFDEWLAAIQTRFCSKKDMDQDMVTLASYALSFVESLADRGEFKHRLATLGSSIASPGLAQTFRELAAKPRPGAEDDLVTQIDRLYLPTLRDETDILLRGWSDAERIESEVIERNMHILRVLAETGSPHLDAKRLYRYFQQTHDHGDRDVRLRNTFVAIGGVLRANGKGSDFAKRLAGELPDLFQADLNAVNSDSDITLVAEEWRAFLDATSFVLMSSKGGEGMFRGLNEQLDAEAAERRNAVLARGRLGTTNASPAIESIRRQQRAENVIRGNFGRADAPPPTTVAATQ